MLLSKFPQDQLTTKLYFSAGSSIRWAEQTNTMEPLNEIQHIQVPASVRPILESAGWSSSRRVPVPSFIPTDHPAAFMFASVGKLRVGKCEAGVECSRSDIDFINPPLLGEDDPIISRWEELLETRLVGIGSVGHGNGHFYVDDKGMCYGLSMIHDAFFLYGLSFGVALEKILLGFKARPLIMPDQESVDLYGITYTHTSPETFDYRKSTN